MIYTKLLSAKKLYPEIGELHKDLDDWLEYLTMSVPIKVKCAADALRLIHLKMDKALERKTDSLNLKFLYWPIVMNLGYK